METGYAQSEMDACVLRKIECLKLLLIAKFQRTTLEVVDTLLYLGMQILHHPQIANPNTTGISSLGFISKAEICSKESNRSRISRANRYVRLGQIVP